MKPTGVSRGLLIAFVGEVEGEDAMLTMPAKYAPIKTVSCSAAGRFVRPDVGSARGAFCAGATTTGAGSS